ncbi:MAG: lipoprotein signal peptidase [Gammaproteobacteria bacterium]|nr:lipoprotein signal peptidase [Gammaproteobacteria bacterium]
MKLPLKIGLLLAVVVIVIDQQTKVWALSVLTLYEPVAIFSGLNMTLAYNPGVAFSLFDEYGDAGRWLLSALAIGVSIFLLAWLWRLQQNERFMGAALGLVLGGALGNVIDRIQFGHVVDFVDVYYQQAHWPAFNVADAAITLGAMLLVWDTLFGKHNDKSSDDH